MIKNFDHIKVLQVFNNPRVLYKFELTNEDATGNFFKNPFKFIGTGYWCFAKCNLL